MRTKINIDSFLRKLTLFSFVLLFPGYFFYHFSIASGFIPPIFGGYFGVVSLILFTPLFLLSFRKLFVDCDLLILVFYLIWILVFFLSGLNFFLSNPNGYAVEMLVWSLSGLLFNLTSFLIASRIELTKFDSGFYYLILAMMFFVVVTNIGENGIFIVGEYAESNSEYISSYQGLARSIVALLLVLTAILIQRGMLFYLVFIAGLVTLYFNGARSEFALYFTSALFLLLVYSIVSLNKLVVLSLFILAFGCSALYVIQYLPDSRMLQLLDITVSSSALARIELIQYGLAQILDNPLLGNYGSYTELGGIGRYPHNIISAWVNLGLLGFVLYLVGFMLLWKEAISGFIKGHKGFVTYKVYLIYLIFVTGALLFTKDYSYMLVGLLLGFYFQYKQSIKWYQGFVKLYPNHTIQIRHI